eukprot:gb/GECG01008339.1/.p1 GENE.gb/GECG01008339.1/~~gb/GECG01008339.1/.p1  ORF type:complete len:448 (+),score=111.81 gb/GECG01008339.1/:1-1344(+)
MSSMASSSSTEEASVSMDSHEDNGAFERRYGANGGGDNMSRLFQALDQSIANVEQQEGEEEQREEPSSSQNVVHIQAENSLIEKDDDVFSSSYYDKQKAKYDAQPAQTNSDSTVNESTSKAPASGEEAPEPVVQQVHYHSLRDDSHATGKVQGAQIASSVNTEDSGGVAAQEEEDDEFEFDLDALVQGGTSSTTTANSTSTPAQSQQKTAEASVNANHPSKDDVQVFSNEIPQNSTDASGTNSSTTGETNTAGKDTDDDKENEKAPMDPPADMEDDGGASSLRQVRKGLGNSAEGDKKGTVAENITSNIDTDNFTSAVNEPLTSLPEAPEEEEEEEDEEDEYEETAPTVKSQEMDKGKATEQEVEEQQDVIEFGETQTTEGIHYEEAIEYMTRKDVLASAGDLSQVRPYECVLSVISLRVPDMLWVFTGQTSTGSSEAELPTVSVSR